MVNSATDLSAYLHDPDVQLMLRAKQGDDAAFSALASWRSTSSTSAGYTFSLNKDKFSLRIFGTVENLLDYEYFESGFRTAGINGRVGVSFGF